MKYLIVSDIHGASDSTRFILEEFEKEKAFDNLKSSTYSKFMMWFLENKKYLTKKAQASFLEILKSWSLRPNNFEYIEAFIPEDFDYTNESIDRLKEEILSKEEENLWVLSLE